MIQYPHYLTQYLIANILHHYTNHWADFLPQHPSPHTLPPTVIIKPHHPRQPSIHLCSAYPPNSDPVPPSVLSSAGITHQPTDHQVMHTLITERLGPSIHLRLATMTWLLRFAHEDFFFFQTHTL